MIGGEHDDKRLPAEGVRPTGLAAVVVGVVFSHGHRVLSGKWRHLLVTSRFSVCKEQINICLKSVLHLNHVEMCRH